MANYKRLITNYFSIWWMMMMRPIYFFTKLKQESWPEGALTFLLQTSWLLAFFATLVIFIIQYVPIGGTLLQIVHGAKIIIVLPVLITLAAVFFVITLLIVGGALVAAIFAGFFALAYVTHYVNKLLGGTGHLSRQIQALFYCSGVLLSGLIILGLMIFSKYYNLDFALFRYGFATILFFTTLYLSGLLAIVNRKNYHLSKPMAFLGALIPFFLLLIFGLLFDRIALSRIQPWIS
jgi:hypothetical protein